MFSNQVVYFLVKFFPQFSVVGKLILTAPSLDHLAYRKETFHQGVPVIPFLGITPLRPCLIEASSYSVFEPTLGFLIRTNSSSRDHAPEKFEAIESFTLLSLLTLVSGIVCRHIESRKDSLCAFKRAHNSVLRFTQQQEVVNVSQTFNASSIHLGIKTCQENVSQKR